MFALHIDYQSGSCIHNITELFEVAGRTSLRATGSIRFDTKTKRVLTKPWQLSMAVLNFFFQVRKGLTYPRDSQVHRALFRAKSLKRRELSNFFDDLSVDDVFGIDEGKSCWIYLYLLMETHQDIVFH